MRYLRKWMDDFDGLGKHLRGRSKMLDMFKFDLAG